MKGRSPSSSIPTKHSSSRAAGAPGAKPWTVRRAVRELARQASQRNVDGMARFGIRAKRVFGVSKPKLDEIARKIRKNHALAIELWETGIHDARLLAVLISQADRVTGPQMERWVKDFDNWDICDGACCHLFVDTQLAWKKAFAWSGRKREFEKRAGFALAAYLAIHDKTAGDRPFEKYLQRIERQASDERNFVRKAVNWALRNIGKRNQRLNRYAIACAEKIRRGGTRGGRWIAADALRELKSQAVQLRLKRIPKGKNG